LLGGVALESVPYAQVNGTVSARIDATMPGSVQRYEVFGVSNTMNVDKFWFEVELCASPVGVDSFLYVCGVDCPMPQYPTDPSNTGHVTVVEIVGGRGSAVFPPQNLFFAAVTSSPTDVALRGSGPHKYAGTGSGITNETQFIFRASSSSALYYVAAQSSALSLTTVNNTAVSVTWSAAGLYDMASGRPVQALSNLRYIVVYVEGGFAPYVEASTPCGLLVASVPSGFLVVNDATSTTLSGLTENVVYSVNVVAECGVANCAPAGLPLVGAFAYQVATFTTKLTV
jgi:hypothetical protein